MEQLLLLCFGARVLQAALHISAATTLFPRNDAGGPACLHLMRHHTVVPPAPEQEILKIREMLTGLYVKHTGQAAQRIGEVSACWVLRSCSCTVVLLFKFTCIDEAAQAAVCGQGTEKQSRGMSTCARGRVEVLR